MAGAVAALFVYAFSLSPYVPINWRFDVYDADTFAPAHYFMVREGVRL